MSSSLRLSTDGIEGTCGGSIKIGGEALVTPLYRGFIMSNATVR